MRAVWRGLRRGCGAPKRRSNSRSGRRARRWRRGRGAERGPIIFATAQFADLPAEVALRLLGRAIAHTGDEGPVELGKLEALYDALRQARSRLRRTLAGAQITLDKDRLTVERAPARRRGKAGRGQPSVTLRARTCNGALRNSDILTPLRRVPLAGGGVTPTLP